MKKKKKKKKENRKKVGRNGRINGGASHTKVVGIK
jgi:hypothetical protein